MISSSGYSLQYGGRNVEITIIDRLEDYMKLNNQLVFNGSYVYYIKDKRIYVLQNRVIASGDFRYIKEEPSLLTIDEWIDMEERSHIDMNHRRKYVYEEKIEKRPIEKVKEENPEWFTETELCEVSNEMVMELSVPTVDELDDYFSSIGYNLSL